MLPLGDVITFAVAVVLQANGVHEICVLQFRVKGFDFFVEIHHAALANTPLKKVFAIPFNTVGDVPALYTYNSK